MPEQNPVTRLYAVATGLGLLAQELEQLLGELAPNLLYWRQEIIEVADGLQGPPVAPPHKSGEEG